MAVRAPPRRAPPPSTAPQTDPREDIDNWVAKRAQNQILKRQFSLEIEQGLLDFPDVQTYSGATALLQAEIMSVRVDIEMFRLEYPEGFERRLNEAVRGRDYDVNFHDWFEDQTEMLNEYRDREIVYFRKRTTAFVLEKPCPNCGKREMIAEAAVFTRAADEAVDQFATCKNCSARYRLQSVL
jgi:DNA-directed RNA polymerase subunit M/transcription elongation factor TFIIS